jgi:hypothetical protein
LLPAKEAKSDFRKRAVPQVASNDPRIAEAAAIPKKTLYSIVATRANGSCKW